MLDVGHVSSKIHNNECDVYGKVFNWKSEMTDYINKIHNKIKVIVENKMEVQFPSKDICKNTEVKEIGTNKIEGRVKNYEESLKWTVQKYR